MVHASRYTIDLNEVSPLTVVVTSQCQELHRVRFLVLGAEELSRYASSQKSACPQEKPSLAPAGAAGRAQSRPVPRWHHPSSTLSCSSPCTSPMARVRSTARSRRRTSRRPTDSARCTAKATTVAGRRSRSSTPMTTPTWSIAPTRASIQAICMCSTRSSACLTRPASSNTDSSTIRPPSLPTPAPPASRKTTGAGKVRKPSTWNGRIPSLLGPISYSSRPMRPTMTSTWP